MIGGGPAAIVAIALLATAASAQGERRYDLAAQDLASALRAFATTSAREVVAPSTIIEGRRSAPVKGTFTPEQAVARLLSGTGLRAEIIEGAFVIRLLADAEPAREDLVHSDDDIVVTGSRIRGAPIAPPVIRINREDFAAAGQAELGEVARSVPQNFGGGQNPGVGATVPATSGVNVGGGSSLNLRGLGSDATLTLLNGRRLPYSSSRQSVDISSIPLAAVERLEIVADGASALYGSDAVAGVANIILRRGVEGLETSARLGASTDGGNFQQLYGALAGARWTGGDAFVAYEFSDSTPINSEDRPYAQSRRPGVTLLPPIRRHSALISAHQSLSERARLSLDALYNTRRSVVTLPLNAAGDLAVSRGVTGSKAEAFVLSPQLEIDLDGDWRVSISGSYGEDRVCFQGDTFAGTTLTSSAGGCYDNDSVVAELGGDGSLLDLPGGPIKLATGAGFRRNAFVLDRGVNNPQTIRAARESTYGYGELNLPLVSPELGVPFIHRLNLSAAARIEHYPDTGDVVTPKFGLIYAPSQDLDIKISWGRSFRTPTFFQQFQVQQVVLFRAAAVGGAGFPPAATALLKLGGNDALRPEKARSWSATLDLHPRAVPDVQLELSYFSTRYVDRIVNPIPFLNQALSNPIFQPQVTLNPSDAQKADVIAAAELFSNGVGMPYDPASVIAIIDGRNVNAGQQTIHGFDALVRYSRDLGDKGTLGLTANAAYLESSQRLTPTQAVQQLAGVLFNPPHFRARATLNWRRNALGLAATVSYIGGVEDRRTAQAQAIEGMTTLDFTARYNLGTSRGLLSNVDLALSAQNLLNAAPEPIATTSFFDTPYDSTNYSAVGRFVSLSLTKRW